MGFISLYESTMQGKIIRIVECENAIMYLIWLKEMNVSARTYTGEGYRNFINWKDLKIGDHLEGLQWKDEKRKLLDADSPVHITQ